MSELRKRPAKGHATTSSEPEEVKNAAPAPVAEPVEQKYEAKKPLKTVAQLVAEASARESKRKSLWTAGLIVVLVLSLLTRMYRIQDPAKVVFDEVHFGKFASYYLRGEYYFDVHPPLGKMLLAAVAAFAGYDGHYLFDEIGDDYVKNGVPWVTMRLFPALCGALIPPFAFLSLKEIGISFPAALFGGFMLIFDNALIAQSRLILLDSMLLLFGVTSIYTWIRFYKERTKPFSFSWWLWMAMTGTSLALTLGIKMVGLFTIGVVGIAVLFDLWKLLDIDRGLTMPQFYQHFAARALCLIILPISLYLSFFYIHFALLPYSGPGDAFMSPRFQTTLTGSEVLTKSTSVPYNAVVTIKHRGQAILLHSHAYNYPLRYENGHVSSEGQQVTGYAHPDANNDWQIIPVDPSLYPSAPVYIPTAQEKERNGVRYVRNNDIVQLKHVTTGAYLLTHDVASPLTNTNMEVTAVKSPESEERYEETLWRIMGTDGGPGEAVRSIRTHFKLVNVKHLVAVHPNTEVLPEWGFGQIEINGEKTLDAKNNVWYFDNVVHDIIVDGKDKYEPEQSPEKKKARGSMPFILKFFELQNVMLAQNAALTSSHPYSSTPGSWPFVLRGISFWETKENLRQIYLLGNPPVWWFAISCVAMYAGIWLVDRIVLRRQVDLFGASIRRWLDNSLGFLFLAWLLHWIPFFLMGRMLFLHHYLPSFIYSVMLAAGLLDFMFRISNEVDPGALVAGDRAKALTVPFFVYFRVKGSLLFWSVLMGMTAGLLYTFWFFSPISYGYGLPDVEAVRARKWFKSWDLQHA